jgi:NADH-quinone oxidoreductase subunit K
MFSLIFTTSLFFIGLFGIILNNTNIIAILMSIELMLLSINLNFLLFSYFHQNEVGIIFALLILTVAAAESAIGLAIIVIFYRLRGNILALQSPVLRG